MLVRDLKKGMLLRFDPKVGVEFDERYCAFFKCGDDYLFFSRTGFVADMPLCLGPFVYMGHRYVYTNSQLSCGKWKKRKMIVREVLCDSSVCTIWGSDFRHLEPLDMLPV